jgi:hypothetical protein
VWRTASTRPYGGFVVARRNSPQRQSLGSIVVGANKLQKVPDICTALWQTSRVRAVVEIAVQMFEVSFAESAFLSRGERESEPRFDLPSSIPNSSSPVSPNGARPVAKNAFKPMVPSFENSVAGETDCSLFCIHATPRVPQPVESDTKKWIVASS